jgi:predicted transposase YbfD/YdcC
MRTEEKNNEIKAVPKLLEMWDVKGDVVTADATNCRKEIAQKIREKGADYILAVKENQPRLYGDIKEYFEGIEMPGDLRQGAEEREHGRVSGGKSGR